MARFGRRPAGESHDARCSFCGKDKDHVHVLVAGPGVFICDQCVDLCMQVVEGRSGGRSFTYPQPNDPEALLRQLQQARTLLDGLGPIVQKLRRKDVSWARIGSSLGISRQAAWERFSGED